MPDIAHPINIGTHGDPSAPGGGDTIEISAFRILDISEIIIKACLYPLTASDGNLITNVTFKISG